MVVSHCFFSSGTLGRKLISFTLIISSYLALGLPVVGVTQHSLGNYNAALESEKRALDIRMKLLGEEHPKTANSYRAVWYLKSVCNYYYYIS